VKSILKTAIAAAAIARLLKSQIGLNYQILKSLKFGLNYPHENLNHQNKF
jgi:hypothetical protein